MLITMIAASWPTAACLTAHGCCSFTAMLYHLAPCAPVQVMSQFAAAALDMLMQAEELDSKEKALMAMRILLLRRGDAGRAALEDEGAEAVLREALTELDLLVDNLGGYGDGEDAGDSGKNQAADQQQQQDGEGYGDEQGPSDKDRRLYATYVAHLCADVLHHLSIQHAEL
jgi:hypothetical protein